MKAVAVRAALGAYGWVSASSILSRPRPRRAFESSYLAYKRLIEAGPVKQLRPYVPAGTAVVDVGANIGYFALQFGEWVGPSGHVYAVEPEARNAAGLRRRLAKAGLDTVVECVHAAAAAEPGTVMLELNPAHPGDHHLGDHGVPVPAVTLDALTAAETRSVSFVKIDVQGAERLVLAGAQRLITEHRPALFIEVDDASLQRLGTSSAELVEDLDRLGYRGRVLTRRGLGDFETPEELARQSVSTYIDVLFLPSSPA